MTSVDNRPLRVFLCHSSNDKPAVRELYQKLRAEPWIQPWLDEEELYPGQDWNMEIEKAVEAADAIIVCLTKNSINKEGYVQRELRIVLDFADYKPEGTVYIIPVRLEECEPPRRLRAWQYADYFEGQRERALERLLISLKKRADSLNLIRIEEPLLKIVDNRDDEQIIVIDTLESVQNVSGYNNQPSVLQEESTNSTRVISSKEDKVKSTQPSVDKNIPGREYYEKVLALVEPRLNPLPKIVVFCLFEYFRTGEFEVFLKDKFRDANKAAESGFLIAADDNEFIFFLNTNDPAISRALKMLKRLNSYIKDDMSHKLFEILKSEYDFDPSLANKRYWESCLYGKSLY